MLIAMAGLPGSGKSTLAACLEERLGAVVLDKDQVRAAYEQKEAEYPVMAGIYRFTSGEGHSARLDREGLVAWARERFRTDLEIESLRSKQRDEIRRVLLRAVP